MVLSSVLPLGLTWQTEVLSVSPDMTQLLYEFVTDGTGSILTTCGKHQSLGQASSSPVWTSSSSHPLHSACAFNGFLGLCMHMFSS